MRLCQVLKIWKQSYQCRITYIRKDMCSDEISNGKLLEGELDKNKTLFEMETVVNGKTALPDNK